MIRPIMRFRTTDAARQVLDQIAPGVPFATRLLDESLPAVGFARVLMADADIRKGRSKIGGNPDLVPEISWPLRTEPGRDPNPARPLSFLAQICLTETLCEIPGATSLPDAGTLHLFVDTWADGRASLRNGLLRICLIWSDPDHDAVVRREPPAALVKGWNEAKLSQGRRPLRTWPEHPMAERLIAAPIVTLREDDPHHLTPDQRAILEALQDCQTTITASGPRLRDLPADWPTDGGVPLGSDQLLGWPAPLAGTFGVQVADGLHRVDPGEDPREDDWLHLLTIQGHSLNEFNLANWTRGVLFVCIRTKDLAAGRLDRAFAFVQQE